MFCKTFQCCIMHLFALLIYWFSFLIHSNLICAHFDIFCFFYQYIAITYLFKKLNGSLKSLKLFSQIFLQIYYWYDILLHLSSISLLNIYFVFKCWVIFFSIIIVFSNNELDWTSCFPFFSITFICFYLGFQLLNLFLKSFY